VKKKAYSIIIQKSKVFGIFDNKKVKNIDIEYRYRISITIDFSHSWLSVSKFWNIGICGQYNIVNWPNIGQKNLKILISASKKKHIGQCLLHTPFSFSGWKLALRSQKFEGNFLTKRLMRALDTFFGSPPSSCFAPKRCTGWLRACEGN